jgi:hypothetical protein
MEEALSRRCVADVSFLNNFVYSVPWPLRGHPEAMKMDPSPS